MRPPAPGGPAGPVGRLLAEGQTTAAEAMLTRLAALFPDRAYVELMRGTPALTQLFIIYFGLADIGLGMPPLPAA